VGETVVGEGDSEEEKPHSSEKLSLSQEVKKRRSCYLYRVLFQTMDCKGLGGRFLCVPDARLDFRIESVEEFRPGQPNS